MGGKCDKSSLKEGSFFYNMRHEVNVGNTQSSLSVLCVFQGMLQTISDVINQFACVIMKDLPDLIVLSIK